MSRRTELEQLIASTQDAADAMQTIPKILSDDVFKAAEAFAAFGHPRMRLVVKRAPASSGDGRRDDE